jgi:acyl carrier protein
MGKDKNKKIILRILKNSIPKDKREKLFLGSRLREDLGLDSIKLIGLVTELESKTNFDITAVDDDVDLAEIATVEDVLNLVNKQCGL